MDMASIAIESALKQAVSVLVDHEFISNVENFQEELHLLVGNLKMVKSFLLDAESKNLKAEAVKGWLQIVQAIAIDIDDVLEEYGYEVLRKNFEESREKDREVSTQVFTLIVSEMVDKIKEINLSLESICQEAVNIGIVPLIKNPSGENELCHIGNYIHKGEIAGRENDVMKLTDMLVNSDNQKDFSVVSIVGIGGQGKTTVARQVYENHVVVNYFEHRIWVSLSEDFDVVRIFHEMVESITGYDDIKRKNKEDIMKQLQQTLKCKRYLIVCDDVCNANKSIWESMEKDFLEISSSRGSKMMVLTRCQEVAEMMNPSLCYRLVGLSDEDSWKLFKERVFGRGRKETAELVDTGKRMVEHCRGIPLAIELISGLLYSMKDDGEWSRISATWLSASDTDVIEKTIRLNFDNLPSNTLKLCFMYCSVLPKNCLMERENVIQIWVAQGLLNSSSNEHTLEATGDLYLNFLLQTSLLREPGYDDSGNVKTCKMHDLVHDFASHISRPYCSNMKLNCVNDATEVEVVDPSVNFHRLRALYLVGGMFGNKLMPNIRRLRMLILAGRNIKELPSSIGELKYLRYLDVSRTSIHTLPDSITKLYNLKTLRVDYIKRLPEKFTNLKNLRYVYGFLQIPNIGKLVNLQTLPSLTVKGEKGFSMQELETLDNLKGKLIIYDIQNVMSREEASTSKLSRKFGISILELHWDLNMKGKCNPNELLEVLKPHSNLTVLSITGFSGNTFPSWMVASNHMRNLVRINLQSCDHCVEVPALGHLPNLQLVEIHWMENVKCIGPEFYGLNELDSTAAVFPSLRKLSLCMPNLEKWLGVRNSSLSLPRIVFPRLQELILDLCRSLTDLPETDCFHYLSHLTISNCCKLASLPNWIQGLVSIENFTLTDSSLHYLPEMKNLVSLQTISITFCDSLVHVPDLSNLTSLQKLEIILCPNLASILSVPCSLESLVIQSCYILNALPELSNVSALRKLDISGCLNIVSIPNVPSALHSLRIDCCRRIKVIPAGLESCNFLEKVCITGCSSLESLDGLQHLSNVKRLEIGEFAEHLDHFPWKIQFHFQYLESLKLIGWSRLKSLPDLQRLPSLRELIIENFNMLEALPEWIRDLDMLKFLEISSCHNLMYLPSVEAMRNLHYLQVFTVWDCPLLKERCDGSGPEWHKISHIPTIGILDGF